ncbi:hypothetical protein KFU94_14210 [Chloroflexi bacterium TSY]|nr:hypothetical protein [Chloroflexi bacterium TSY]
MSTMGQAAGDWDGDGDLDIAQGNFEQPNIVFEHPLHSSRLLVNNSAYVQLTHPGSAAPAEYFASARIIREQTIPVEYTLFDPEGDSVRLIRAYYSINGGGH